MDETKKWHNIAIDIQYIEKGEDISIEVEGGFAQKVAPCDGMMITDRMDRTIFAPSITSYLLGDAEEEEEPTLEVVVTPPPEPRKP